MSKITSLMTSLHEGHKAEERIKCIDNMFNKCEDTKFTVLQAFWWYRKYTKAKLEKLEKIEQILNAYDGSTPSMIKQFSEIQKVLEKG